MISIFNLTIQVLQDHAMKNRRRPTFPHFCHSLEYVTENSVSNVDFLSFAESLDEQIAKTHGRACEFHHVSQFQGSISAVVKGEMLVQQKLTAKPSSGNCLLYTSPSPR